LPETDKLHKITIIPRGSALGLTQQVSIEERYTYSLVYLLNRIKILLGGRIAKKKRGDEYEKYWKSGNDGPAHPVAGEFNTPCYSHGS
jgi:ATP-dependent Zn protease